MWNTVQFIADEKNFENVSLLSKTLVKYFVIT